MKMKTQHTKIYEMQQKQSCGKFTAINAYIKKQETGFPWWSSG